MIENGKYAPFLLAVPENCGQGEKMKNLEMTSKLGIPVSVTSTQRLENFQ